MFSHVLRVSVVLALACGVTGVARADSGTPTPMSTNGHKVHLVATGLDTPTSFAFGDNSIFEGDYGNENGTGTPSGGVFLLKNGTATQLPGSPTYVTGLAWHKASLYLAGGVLTSSGTTWQLDKWSDWTGETFGTQKVIYSPPTGFDGFNGLGFGANGRLYAGVDVGLTDGNDHGPATTSPYVYDILSLRSDGSHLKVFAQGIRQPYQFAFPAGSNSPYVSVLGQDSHAKNPPDFILRAKAGQNYGFPMCNHTKAAACSGYAKPFDILAPHTDPVGIGLRRSRLYITSFDSPGDVGPGGEVESMPSTGGSLKPLIKGFTYPAAGLGIHKGVLYVGELNGDVYRLKL